MQQLNSRQQKILDFLSKGSPAGNSEIIAFLGEKTSRFTVLRDLNFLIGAGAVKKTGKGRGVKYGIFSAGPLLSYVDVENYFKKGPDEREVKPVFFNEDVIKLLPGLFSAEEVRSLSEINRGYVERSSKMDSPSFRKEVERLTIELSWKSSQIEGNTYSLIDTETLIKDRIEAEGHKKEEAVMILNHKNAVDYIFNRQKEFKKLNLSHIETIHDLLTRGLNVKPGIRDGSVRIVGTRYKPIDGKEKIFNLLHKTIEAVNSLADPFSRSLSLILLLSYLQPFSDGNKRTARIVGNAILLAGGACPLSYRSVSDSDYKKATLLFYEQNSALFFKKLFVEQFKFAVDTYF